MGKDEKQEGKGKEYRVLSRREAAWHEGLHDVLGEGYGSEEAAVEALCRLKLAQGDLSEWSLFEIEQRGWREDIGGFAEGECVLFFAPNGEELAEEAAALERRDLERSGKARMRAPNGKNL